MVSVLYSVEPLYSRYCYSKYPWGLLDCVSSLMGCFYFRSIYHALGHFNVSLIQGCPQFRGLDWRGSTIHEYLWGDFPPALVESLAMFQGTALCMNAFYILQSIDFHLTSVILAINYLALHRFQSSKHQQIHT